MNENINLTKILKYCPKGFKLYSSIYGTVTFKGIDYNDSEYPICIETPILTAAFTKKGQYFRSCSDSECTLFPSKDQRDWSKFTAPWHKKKRFNPKTFQSFDRILVLSKNEWVCRIISHTKEDMIYVTSGGFYDYCIPYNEETKHLVGTNKEAPEYYRYWED